HFGLCRRRRIVGRANLRSASGAVEVGVAANLNHCRDGACPAGGCLSVLVGHAAAAFLAALHLLEDVLEALRAAAPARALLDGALRQLVAGVLGVLLMLVIVVVIALHMFVIAVIIGIVAVIALAAD